MTAFPEIFLINLEYNSFISSVFLDDFPYGKSVTIFLRFFIVVASFCISFYVIFYNF
ncbi:MAG: hypothetical protein KatS3mg002_1620 [Candidatus Woesearchaeota archaeon]|nr:MAG: hypothetical protein KatS3mg002_1620 [Candidatus Woesearchaeota archaeon]